MSYKNKAIAIALYTMLTGFIFGFFSYVFFSSYDMLRVVLSVENENEGRISFFQSLGVPGDSTDSEMVGAVTRVQHGSRKIAFPATLNGCRHFFFEFGSDLNKMKIKSLKISLMGMQLYKRSVSDFMNDIELSNLELVPCGAEIAEPAMLRITGDSPRLGVRCNGIYWMIFGAMMLISFAASSMFFMVIICIRRLFAPVMVAYPRCGTR